MKKFREWLQESIFASKQLKNNASVTQLKTIAKNDKSNQARYVIDKDGKLHAGAARHYNHRDICPHNESDVAGFVTHDNGEYRFDAYHADYDKPGPPKDHPMFDRFETHNIRRERYNSP